ncbi:hypothetical protein CPB83DRAFT_861718 [Crepidotus variabilis]|uniref:Oxidase ustYa n=1 Tax=Crepidotus variabilis TaxID=179855 RepID=A0A9P6JKQ3_9AGAR|nr:hypothetical protein CPB83DRAFT_861718 [Crepidotus variabilis]
MAIWHRTLASILLVSLNLFNLGYIVITLLKTREARVSQETYSYRGHDYPETLPLPMGEPPLVLMTDEESVHYPLLGMESDSEWFALADLESGSGYLRLGPENRIFAVSMFHQMHCLRMINLAFLKAHIASPPHLHHCLNYLRQAALCKADLSLEPGNFEERNFETQRSGATHLCQDWSAVYPFMETKYQWWKSLNGTKAE